MSYRIHKCRNNNSLWRFSICDNLSDIANFPTAVNDGKA